MSKAPCLCAASAAGLLAAGFGAATLLRPAAPQPAALQPAVVPFTAATAAPAAPQEPTLADAEKSQILAVLDECRGNKSEAARRLGISRRTLHRKLNEWRLI